MFSKKSTRELVQGGKRSLKESKARAVEPSPGIQRETEDNAEGSVVKKEPSAFLHKSRYLIGVVCLVLAVFIAFILLPRLYNQREVLTSVVTLQGDVEAGEMLAADMLSVSEVGAYGLPEGVLRDVNTAIGMVAAEPLYAGEMLWRDRLVSESEYSSEQKTERPITQGHCLVTLEVPNTAAGGAGILHAGDVVDIFKIIENEEGLYDVSKSLSQLLVYDVLNESMKSMSNDRDGDKSIDADAPASERRPLYVVFDVTDEQAAELIALAQNGMLHMTKPYTGG